jgi:hypothetical protein
LFNLDIPEAISRAIEYAQAEETPTPEDKRKQMIKNVLSTGKDDWNTPPEIIAYWMDQYKDIPGFTDPCPNDHTVDGLHAPWGQYNFINPPYSDGLMDAFINKAYLESLEGKESIMIIPPKTEKKVFKELIMAPGHAYEIIFITGRISFIDPSNGRPIQGNTRGSMFVLYGRTKINRPRVNVIDKKIFNNYKGRPIVFKPIGTPTPHDARPDTITGPLIP